MSILNVPGIMSVSGSITRTGTQPLPSRTLQSSREDCHLTQDGNPLQYSCLENSMDGGAWWGHKESDMTEQLTMLSNIFCFYWIFIFLFLYECPIFCSLPICFLLVLFFVRTLSHLPCLLSISLSHFFYVFNIIFLFLALKNIFIAEHKLCSPNAVVLILTGQL